MNRDDILEAAAQVFSEKGFHAASMRDIARTVNLRKASLYHHINSKQELLLALLDQALHILIEQLQLVVDAPLPAQKKLREAIRTYLSALAEHRDLAAVLLFEHRSLEPGLRGQHVPRRDRFEQLWREILEEGIASGEFRSLDTSLAAKTLLGAINWTLTWYRTEGSLTAEEIADDIADLVLKGCLGDPEAQLSTEHE